ncbi:hypothetical protein Tco_0668311 [Tanacetum coccineum]
MLLGERTEVLQDATVDLALSRTKSVHSVQRSHEDVGFFFRSFASFRTLDMTVIWSLLDLVLFRLVDAMAAGISTTYPIATMAEVIGLAGKGDVVQLFHLTSPPTDTHAVTLF